MLNCWNTLIPHFIWQILKGISAIHKQKFVVAVLLEYDVQGLLPDRDEIICWISQTFN